MGSTHGRMALALGTSALLHAWAMHDTCGLGVPRVAAGSSAPLAATLDLPSRAPAVDLLAQDPTPGTPQYSAVVTPPRATAAVTAKAPVAPAVETPAAATLAGQGSAPLPQPSDPTYYGALSLDVYPKAVTALDLSAPTAAAGQVRATVLIDEAGVVNDVRAVQATSADLESAARTLLWQTRFTPARKDGRVVKAEVRVSLGYGTP